MNTGVQNQLSLEIESTYGTPVTPTLSLPIQASDGVQINQEVLGAEAIRGTSPKNKAFYKGKQIIEGGYKMALYPRSAGYFLKSAMGTDTPSLLETGVYKHTLTESATKPGLTVEQMVDNIVKRFSGFVVGNFKITGAVGQEVMLEVSGKAKSSADATAISKTYETFPSMDWSHVTTLSIGGTDIKAKVSSFEMEYDNGLEMFYGLGTVTPADRYSKQSIFKGKIEAFVDATTAAYLTDLTAVTERALVLDITGSSLIGATKYAELKVMADKCAFTKFTTKLGFDYNAVTLEFEAREDTTNGLVKIELTNNTASY